MSPRNRPDNESEAAAEIALLVEGAIRLFRVVAKFFRKGGVR